MTHFLVDLIGRFNGSGYLATELGAEILTEPVYAGAHGAGGLAQFSGGFLVGSRGLFADEIGLEHVENFTFSATSKVGFELRHGGFDGGDGPFAFEYCFGGRLIGEVRSGKLRFDVAFVDGDWLYAAAAFLGVVADDLAGHVVLQGCEQIATEFPFERIGTGEGLALNQAEEEALDRILRAVVIVTPAAGERIERLPIRFAEVGHRLVGTRCLSLR